MADDVTLPGLGTVVAADDVGGKLWQRIKLGLGADGTATDLAPGRAAASSCLPVVDAPATTATLSNVSASATSVTVLASASTRMGAYFYNDSTATLYLKLGASGASTTSFTVKIDPDTFYELPAKSAIYTGAICGIWSAASGTVRVTELTP